MTVMPMTNMMNRVTEAAMIHQGIFETKLLSSLKVASLEKMTKQITSNRFCLTQPEENVKI